ncbi:MAG: hypothetical protein JWO41_265 [Candidatus Saccharibacteria bacterium]|nr:hypothetical protein [Candidatus Saccharibacteria bacterium]
MKEPVTIIGRSEPVDFPEFRLKAVAARIDTGAKTSSIWASNIVETNGKLHFTLFDKPSAHYSGIAVVANDYAIKVVASSNGLAEERYVVRLQVELAGRKIRARFTLANRASQAYPVLIGRNILRGKFLVDVAQGHPLHAEERRRSKELQAKLEARKEQA